ncbi:hypothetical protein BN10_540019 [Phycicoccus elongatus Lp2]|uniref:Uncharacterized protein n=1 Tax=Phycicoccus elongatus Lp2 TaxID=1193181 RepID=N0E3I2_9MICO|nr:hypothetical protein BN10_540019 [Phycicoccus elongatus Lp2]
MLGPCQRVRHGTGQPHELGHLTRKDSRDGLPNFNEDTPGDLHRAGGRHPFGQSGARRGGVGDTAYQSLKMYAVKSRFRYSLRSWTRFATPMPLGPASARPSWPAVTSS